MKTMRSTMYSSSTIPAHQQRPTIDPQQGRMTTPD